jgi:hypothetical protein
MKKSLPVFPEGFADPKLPKGTFSHSQYSKWKTCAKAYQFRYVQGIDTPASVNMFRGTAVHAGAEAAHLHMIEHKTVPSLEEMRTKVSDAFEAGKDQVQDWEGEQPGAVKDLALKLYEKYHTENLPKLRPVAAEEGFAVKVGTVPVTGYIDLVEQHSGFGTPSGNDPITIVDLKTSSAKWSASDVEKDTQLTLYSIVKKTPLVRIDNLVTLKAGPAFHRFESTRSKDQQRVFQEDFEETAEFIRQGVFPKASIDSWACSEKWCGYWSLCRGKKV